LNRKGFLVNRLELTFPGKNAVLLCEVLSMTSFLGKDGKQKNFSPLTDDLEVIRTKLKPFIGNRTFCLRVTCLDGLLFHKSMKALEKSLLESLQGKKLGAGMLSFSSDLVRVICLSMQIPVAGLFVSA
jgi:hypothetical protein